MDERLLKVRGPYHRPPSSPSEPTLAEQWHVTRIRLLAKALPEPLSSRLSDAAGDLERHAQMILDRETALAIRRDRREKAERLGDAETVLMASREGELAEAERHVRQAEEAISRQVELIAELERPGQSDLARTAGAVLDTLTRSLRLAQQHVERLRHPRH